MTLFPSAPYEETAWRLFGSEHLYCSGRAAPSGLSAPLGKMWKGLQKKIFLRVVRLRGQHFGWVHFPCPKRGTPRVAFERRSWRLAACSQNQGLAHQSRMGPVRRLGDGTVNQRFFGRMVGPFGMENRPIGDVVMAGALSPTCGWVPPEKLC